MSLRLVLRKYSRIRQIYRNIRIWSVRDVTGSFPRVEKSIAAHSSTGISSFLFWDLVKFLYLFRDETVETSGIERRLCIWSGATWIVIRDTCHAWFALWCSAVVTKQQCCCDCIITVYDDLFRHSLSLLLQPSHFPADSSLGIDALFNW